MKRNKCLTPVGTVVRIKCVVVSYGAWRKARILNWVHRISKLKALVEVLPDGERKFVAAYNLEPERKPFEICARGADASRKALAARWHKWMPKTMGQRFYESVAKDEAGNVTLETFLEGTKSGCGRLLSVGGARNYMRIFNRKKRLREEGVTGLDAEGCASAYRECRAESNSLPPRYVVYLDALVATGFFDGYKFASKEYEKRLSEAKAQYEAYKQSEEQYE